MENTTSGVTDAERRAHVEALLAHYPELTEDELQVLLRWFRHQASALDVALLASNPDLGKAYARFKADHLDRMGAKDYALIAGVVATLVAFIAFAVLSLA